MPYDLNLEKHIRVSQVRLLSDRINRIGSDRIIVGSDTKILSDSKIGSDRIRPYPIRYPNTYPTDIGRISDIRRKWALGENSMLSIVYFATQ